MRYSAIDFSGLAMFRHLATVAMLLLPVVATAGVFDPHDPPPFTVKADGTAEPLSFANFKFLLVERTDALNPASPADYRKQLNDRLAQLPPPRSPDAVVERAAVLHRLGQTDGASGVVSLLEPFTREADLDYRVLSQLGQTYALRGDFELAARRHADALEVFDPDHPPTLPGMKPATATWLLRVDREYVSRWLRGRRKNATEKVPAGDTALPALFVGANGQPVPIFGPAYTASPESRLPAGLPPDAIAIVQQLALWAPDDGGLLWLLAELYVANGQLREANELFDMLAWGRSLSNWKVLMEHRAAVVEAVKLLPAVSENTGDDGDPTVDQPDLFGGLSWWQIAGAVAVFTLIAVGLVVLQVRSILKRGRNR